jgi:hypothetical protein
MHRRYTAATAAILSTIGLAFAGPAIAQADYMHADQCRNGLRGATPNNIPRDNEIRGYELAHSVGFIQWGSAWHPNDKPISVYQYAWFSNGVAKLFWCLGNDLNFNDGPWGGTY